MKLTLHYLHTLRDAKKRTTYVLIVAFIVLAAVGMYGAWYANADRSTNGDALIYTSLFSGHFWPHKIILSDIHANIVKFPIYIVQAWLPHTYTMFSIVNFTLVLATLMTWGLLVAKIFNKKAAAVSLLVMAAMLSLSSELNRQIVYSTVRNIEFPISLFFIYVIGRFVQSRDYVKRHIIICGLAFLLFATTMAGDHYFTFVVGLPLCVILAYPALRRGAHQRNAWLALGIVGLSLFASFAISKVFTHSGLYSPDKSYLAGAHNVTSVTIWPSIKFGTMHFLHIIGYGTFYKNAVVGFLVLCIVGVAVYGFICALQRDVFTRHYAFNFTRFMTGAAAIIFVGCLAIYIGSAFPLTVQLGQIQEMSENDRYIALLPFLMMLGIAYAVTVTKLHTKMLTTTVALLGVIIMVGTVSSLPKATAIRYAAGQQQAVLKQLAGSLEREHVSVMLGGYWYATATPFWSDGKITSHTINACNLPYVINSRSDWTIPSKTTVRSAYIIDPSGPDSPFFSDCSEDKLSTIFGKPTSVLHPASFAPHGPLNALIYNYDIRSQLIR